MNIYTVRLSEQQLKIVQDAMNHHTDVTIEYMDYDEPTIEETKLLRDMFQDAIPGDTINEFGL